MPSQWRVHSRKRRRKQKITHLIPREWFTPLVWSLRLTVAGPLHYPSLDPWKASRKEIQAHLDSCYGNIYSCSNRIGNHMLMGSFVGNGSYLSLTWLCLQKNEKWEQSMKMEGANDYFDWTLVSEMGVDL